MKPTVSLVAILLVVGFVIYWVVVSLLPSSGQLPVGLPSIMSGDFPPKLTDEPPGLRRNEFNEKNSSGG